MKIFVTVGNARVPFDRLLQMVDEAQTQLEWSGTCQHGVSSMRPRGLLARESLSRSDFDDAIRLADAVVCHAGVGTLWSAIEAGHTPLVVPRRQAFGEVVNEHQLEICRALEQLNRIAVVGSAAELVQRLRETATAPRVPLVRDLTRLEPVACALSDIAQAAARSPERKPSRLLKLLATLAPPLDRLRMRT